MRYSVATALALAAVASAEGTQPTYPIWQVTDFTAPTKYEFHFTVTGTASPLPEGGGKSPDFAAACTKPAGAIGFGNRVTCSLSRGSNTIVEAYLDLPTAGVNKVVPVVLVTFIDTNHNARRLIASASVDYGVGPQNFDLPSKKSEI